jgi:hypothetical protein
MRLNLQDSADINSVFKRTSKYKKTSMSQWVARRYGLLPPKLGGAGERGYDPNQPRVAAGNSNGGQWTNAANSGAVEHPIRLAASVAWPRSAVPNSVSARYIYLQYSPVSDLSPAGSATICELFGRSFHPAAKLVRSS